MEITINYYGQAVSVSVEVYEYLTQADHKAENLAHEQRRHWDGHEYDEYIISTEGRLPYCATPEELVCQRETLDELLTVLALCTPHPAGAVLALRPARFQLCGDCGDVRLLQSFRLPEHHGRSQKVFQILWKNILTIAPLSGYQVRGVCSITGSDKQFWLFVPLAI